MRDVSRGRENVMDPGPYGIWTAAPWKRDPESVAEAAALVEGLGFTALWIPGYNDVFERCRTILASTTHLIAATGIASIWIHEPSDMVAACHERASAYPGRFLLGLGVSHALSVNPAGQHRYDRPITRLKAYLDALDAASPPLPPSGRVLAALGPKMLALA